MHPEGLQEAHQEGRIVEVRVAAVAPELRAVRRPRQLPFGGLLRRLDLGLGQGAEPLADSNLFLNSNLDQKMRQLQILNTF